MILLLLLVEFFLLFLLSRLLTIKLFSLLWHITGSHRVAISLTTAVLFPGTVIHELSHLFVAEILGVRTGTLTLVPEALDEKEGEVRSGSVAIAKTDPLRRTLIGLAPTFVGLFALTGISYYFQQWNHEAIVTIVLFYLLFVISNTMFSSHEDMKGVIPFLVTVTIFAAAAYAAGLRFFLAGPARDLVTTVAQSLTHSLALVLAVNGVLLLILKLLRKFVGR